MTSPILVLRERCVSQQSPSCLMKGSSASFSKAASMPTSEDRTCSSNFWINSLFISLFHSERYFVILTLFCHSERSEESRVFATERTRDPSPPKADQDDTFLIIPAGASVAGQIETHIFEAEIFQRPHNVGPTLQTNRHPGGRNFDPRHLVMITDPHLLQPQIFQEIFRRIDFLQSAEIDRRAGGDS